ncbi:MAG TPA: XF1762 family protein [Methylomirabilota bacterium]|nr:XF1762 family protein [Methylomirabilota bacterium]
MPDPTLEVVPCTLRAAFAYIAAHHRHHRPPQGGLFAVAVAKEGQVCGVAVVGMPVARMLADGVTAEVTRVATDGTKNACSMLYAACRRAALALGWRKLVTYTLPEEGGASLRGAGWRVVAERTGGGSWSRPRRPRADSHPLQPKVRWESS